MKKLFVGNMSFQTKEGDLRALFEPFGQVTRIQIVDAPRHLLGGAVEVTDLTKQLNRLRLRASGTTSFSDSGDSQSDLRSRSERIGGCPHRGATFAALGSVAYARASEGMRIVFGEIEDRDRAILDAWLGEKQP